MMTQDLDATRASRLLLEIGAVQGAVEGFFAGAVGELVLKMSDKKVWQQSVWRVLADAGRALLKGGAQGDGLAFLHRNVHQHAGGGRWDFGVNLVGGDLEQRFVAVDDVADLLDPADDGALGNRLAHLGHDYECWHVVLSPSN